MPGSPRRSRAKATSSPGSITIGPTPTTRASLTSPTRSGSGRATSRRLLKDPVWGNAIDAQRICVAGHSQGGFTSLWIGGAKVNADKFLAFQQGWKNNQQIPAYLRNELLLDPAPALDVRDPRIKAAFAMAPGIIKAFGMDEAGLRQMTIPAYITVGARDTQTPPQDNAAFAAANIPGAKLVIIPGLVDHEIFVNECDNEGRDEFPEACIDAPGVDRHAIHRDIGAAALTFFDAHLPSEGEK
jgi:predicted dienelactone hydrolase